MVRFFLILYSFFEGYTSRWALHGLVPRVFPLVEGGHHPSIVTVSVKKESTSENKHLQARERHQDTTIGAKETLTYSSSSFRSSSVPTTLVFRYEPTQTDSFISDS